ncbi:hypothetical protein [Acinetobacter sp. 102]|uniref:hypothetical protein n=1 Tax=Acinetobacter sp. 102 TaxID=3098766 RepID=UPI00300ACE65
MINFENVPVVAERIKRSNLELQENGFYWTHATDFQSLSDQDYVNSCYYGWQHRQTEVDELQHENNNLKSLIQGHELRQKLNLSIKKNLRNKNQDLLEQIESYEDLMQGLLDQRLNLDDLEQALKGEG